MKSKNKYIVFFDIETTGLNKDFDRIVQIGMHKMDYNGTPSGDAEYLINPCGVKSSAEAFEKHGLSDEMLAKEKPFEHYADAILEFMKDCDLGGHNCIPFDIPFLMAEFGRCGRLFTIENRRIIDTRFMYLHYNPRHLVDMYREYVGREPELRAHDAANDAHMCSELFLAIKERHNTTVDDIDAICGNNTRIDAEGFFVIGENNQICMGKGKYKGMVIEKVDPTYFDWIANNNDISLESRGLASRIYRYVLNKK